jgi:hypothetical protein
MLQARQAEEEAQRTETKREGMDLVQRVKQVLEKLQSLPQVQVPRKQVLFAPKFAR